MEAGQPSQNVEQVIVSNDVLREAVNKAYTTKLAGTAKSGVRSVLVEIGNACFKDAIDRLVETRDQSIML